MLIVINITLLVRQYFSEGCYFRSFNTLRYIKDRKVNDGMEISANLIYPKSTSPEFDFPTPPRSFLVENPKIERQEKCCLSYFLAIWGIFRYFFSPIMSQCDSAKFRLQVCAIVSLTSVEVSEVSARVDALNKM